MPGQNPSSNGWANLAHQGFSLGFRTTGDRSPQRWWEHSLPCCIQTSGGSRTCPSIWGIGELQLGSDHTRPIQEPLCSAPFFFALRCSAHSIPCVRGQCLTECPACENLSHALSQHPMYTMRGMPFFLLNQSPAANPTSSYRAPRALSPPLSASGRARERRLVLTQSPSLSPNSTGTRHLERMT